MGDRSIWRRIKWSPKEEIINGQEIYQETYQGVTSKVWGEVNATKDVKIFTFKAPEDYQIIDWFFYEE